MPIMKDEREFRLCEGAIIRLLMLQTHYRSPVDFSQRRLEEAERVLERWMRACVPSPQGPPIEVLEALCDDLNTPKAIAAMHVFRKNDGKKLFAAMRFLGFFNDGVCHPTEVKTLPDSHIAGHGPSIDGELHGGIA